MCGKGHETYCLLFKTLPHSRRISRNIFLATPLQLPRRRRPVTRSTDVTPLTGNHPEARDVSGLAG